MFCKKYEQLDFFSMLSSPEETDLQRILRHGSGFSGGKQRIARYFESEASSKDACGFLKNEYGIGGWSQQFADGNGMVESSGKGITIHKYKTGSVRLYSWREIEKELRKMIQNGNYLESTSC